MAKRSSVRNFCDDIFSRFISLRDVSEDVEDSRARFGLPKQWGRLRPDASEEEIRKNDDYDRAFAEWGEEFKKRESKAALAVTKSWGASWKQELKQLYARGIREIGEKGLARYLSKFERLYSAFFSMIEDAESGQCDLQGYGGDCDFVEAFRDFETIALAFDEPSESGADAPPISNVQTEAAAKGIEHDERPAKAKAISQQFAFDDGTHTIFFGTTGFPNIDPTAYFMFKAIEARKGQRITHKEMKLEVRGLNGKNAVVNTKKKLPSRLQECVKSTTAGHFLRLPTE